MTEKLVSEAEWKDALAGLPAFSPPFGPVILLAPHPDDESLATGGLIAALANRGTALAVVAVTDGDAAYNPDGDLELAELRRREQTSALSILGLGEDQILRFSLPDRWVHEHEAALTERLVDLLETTGPTTTLIAPWRYDFHSDHEAVGRAAEQATIHTGTNLVRWFWWSWHRRTVPELSVLPLKRFTLEPHWLQLKLAAIAEHRSQLGEGAILPKSLLAPAYRDFEVFA
jgi:LmbE family N-acetylglucosaminyl deacetylase